LHSCCFFERCGITFHHFLPYKLSYLIVLVLLVLELMLMHCLLPSISDQSQLSLSLNYLTVSKLLHSYYFFERYEITYHHFLPYKLSYLIVMVSSVLEQMLKCCLLPSISDQSQLSLSLNYLTVSKLLHSYYFFERYEITYH